MGYFEKNEYKDFFIIRDGKNKKSRIFLDNNGFIFAKKHNELFKINRKKIKK